jgi:hypothetical protein
MFVDRKELSQLLRSTLTEPRSIAEISKASYVHTNGFYKIVLVSSTKPEYKLRLHVWPARLQGRSSREPDIHNHRWDFGSYLAAGSYFYEEFQEDEAGEAMYKYEYAPLNAIGDFALTRLGKMRVCCKFGCLMMEGTRYTLRADVLHHVIHPGACFTATLVLQSRKYRTSTFVFSRTRKEALKKADSAPMSVDAVQSALSQTLSYLER